MTILKPSVNFPWTDSTPTYPAGSNPWSSQPTGVDPLQDYFSPDRTLPAEELNKLLSDRDVCLDAVVDQVNTNTDNLAKRLLAIYEVDWSGTEAWTTGSFTGPLQAVWSAVSGYQDGDEFHFSVSGTVGTKPMTEGHLRLLCSEDPSSTGWGTDPGGVTGMAAGGYQIVGPAAWASVNGGSPTTVLSPATAQCWPLAVSGKFVKSATGTYGSGVYLYLSGKVFGRGDQGSPSMLVNQGVSPLTSSILSVRVEIWRP